jgi:hypothetical protein
VIARWKGIVEEIHFGGSIMPLAIIENLDLEKPSFGPSKWPRKLKPAKNSKLPKWPENCFEPFGKGGWPPISTWINNKWDFQSAKISIKEHVAGLLDSASATMFFFPFTYSMSKSNAYTFITHLFWRSLRSFYSRKYFKLL